MPRSLRLVIALLFAAAFGPAPADPALADTDSAPDSRAALRAIIADLTAERIVAGRYSDALAADIERQRSFLVPTLQAAGPLRSLEPLAPPRPAQGGQVDRYIAEHENGSFLWSISVDDKDVTTLLLLVPRGAFDTEESERAAAEGAILTEIIRELGEGIVDKARYTDALAAEVERQRAILLPTVAAAGPLESLRFLNLTSSESSRPIHQFLATHRNVRFLWTISRTDAGAISLLLVQPAD